MTKSSKESIHLSATPICLFPHQQRIGQKYAKKGGIGRDIIENDDGEYVKMIKDDI